MSWVKAKCATSECAEAQRVWRRARCANTECGEAARDGSDVLLRSSQRPAQIVTFTDAEWTVFVAGVKAGDFDAV